MKLEKITILVIVILEVYYLKSDLIKIFKALWNYYL